MAFYEHASRSLIKTITYRVVIVISSAVITYIVTRDNLTTAKVILIGNVTSTLLYYVHERAWNSIHWGKKHIKKQTR